MKGTKAMRNSDAEDKARVRRGRPHSRHDETTPSDDDGACGGVIISRPGDSKHLRRRDGEQLGSAGVTGNSNAGDEEDAAVSHNSDATERDGAAAGRRTMEEEDHPPPSRDDDDGGGDDDDGIEGGEADSSSLPPTRHDEARNDPPAQSRPGAFHMPGPSFDSGTFVSYLAPTTLRRLMARGEISAAPSSSATIVEQSAPIEAQLAAGDDVESRGGGGGEGRSANDDSSSRVRELVLRAITSPSAPLVHGTRRPSNGVVRGQEGNEESTGREKHSLSWQAFKKWLRCPEKRWKIGVSVTVIAILLGIVAALVSIHAAPSSSSSRGQTSEVSRFEAFKMLVLPLSGANALEDASSPQYRALAWIADGDERAVSPDDEGAATQRYALATMYFATGGRHWERDCDFLSSRHECDWNVLSGNNRRGVWCNSSKNAVVSIDLRMNNLTGPLPHEVSLLSQLGEINLAINNLVQTIPPSIGNLRRLELLDLGLNDFSGNIPDTLGQLSALKILWLGSPALSGTIPESITKLSNLQSLALGNMALTGTIDDSIGELSNLHWLSLAVNLLTGSIPSSINNLKKLEFIFSGFNNFEGSLPFLPGGLPSLKAFISTNCNFSGEISTVIGTLENMEWISLSDNDLTGTLPSNLENLSLLRNFGASGNRLSGTIPAMGTTDLEWLQLGDNFFSGSIPSNLFEHKGLQIIMLENNRLNGTIQADGFTGLSDLWFLNLRNNLFSGQIPYQMGHLSNLRYFDLSHNRLNGRVQSESFECLEQLEWFSVSRNDLSGELDFLCRIDGTQFLADCAGPNPEVSCPCCTICCEDGEEDCDSRVLMSWAVILELCRQTYVAWRMDEPYFSKHLCDGSSLFAHLDGNRK